MPPRPVIPGYRLRSRLGGGPHADVFAAVPESGGPAVALKVLRASHESNADALLLFQREAEAGLSVRHRYLVPFLDASTDAYPRYLVMKLLPGGSAKDRVLNRGRMSVTVALAVARQIAEALTAIHDAGFIHGDVKSDNIRLASSTRATLVDLGFAHRAGDLAAWADRGHMMGTPNYMAPELCWKPPTDTAAADIFSLGVTLFELLTGELPYVSGPVRDVIRRRRTDGAVELANVAGDWPAGLPELLTRMTMPDCTARPRSKQVVQRLTSLQILALRKRAG